METPRIDTQFDSQKISYHPAWLKRWLDNPFSTPPIYIEISPIGLCNHRCTFCAKEVMGYPDRSIPKERLIGFIRELAWLRSQDPDGLGVRSLMHAGEGEPTLYKDLAEVIAETARCGIESALTTNATGLTEKFLDPALPHLSWIKASVNAGKKETYTKIHKAGPNHWDTIWRNLGKAVEMRTKFGYSCEIGCQTVLLVNDTLDLDGTVVPANWHEAIDLAKKAKETGLDHVVIKPYGQNPYSLGTMQRYGDMKYTGFLKEFEKMDGELQKLNDANFKVVFRWNTILSYEKPKREYEKCLATPMSWAYLQSDGMIISCAAHNSNPDFDLGNITDKTFKEIWWGERRRQHIEFMKNFDISACRKNCRMHFVNEALWDLETKRQSGPENVQETFQPDSLPKNVNFI
ncbi:MAG: radical SAM protein [Candidatus Yanofskybacteria bacterium]|nr:radical SAM protein [Candidatus Yanofskybacteria bacterium]